VDQKIKVAKDMSICFGHSETIGLRDSMEDVFAIGDIPKYALFRAEVYDGHGGSAAALIAAATLTPYFLALCDKEDLKPAKQQRPRRELLREAYLAVDEFLVRKMVPGGTAAATIYIWQDEFLAANVGDARIAVGTDGGAICLTIDHKPDLPAEKARIESLGGRVITYDVPRVQGQLAMSRALGDYHLKPYVIPEPRMVEGYWGKENDYAVVACDGVWDVLEPGEVLAIARDLDDPEKAAQYITDSSLEKGSTDNITVLVLDLRHNARHLKRETITITFITDMAANTII